MQQGGEAVEGCVDGGFAQSVEMVLAEAEQQAAVAEAVDAGQLQGQGGGGVLFGAGGGGGEFGGEEVEMEGVRPGAAVVVVGEFLQGFVAPRQAAVFDCLAAVKLAGVDAVRAFDVAGEGVVSAMNAGQKPWLSRCWLRMSGEGRMKFWWRLAKFMGGSLGRFASGGRCVCRAGCSELDAAVAEKPLQPTVYSGLNLNQYGVASPCRTICTVCGFVALS